ncbi:MAG: hypothetical protein R3A51_11240 [Nannocystaceae bacterium]|nr:hypothetical protein [Myxococcales bacterium]
MTSVEESGADAGDGLDGLIERCRNPRSRVFLVEAIACLRAGALRSCLVMTWSSVVFDLISKLHELHVVADEGTKKRLAPLRASLVGDPTALPDAASNRAFEREVLGFVEQLELITRAERIDLDRLERDAALASHPAFYLEEGGFTPDDDLARAHLESAVAIVLAREPIQGHARLDSVWEVIASPYFPVHPVAARECLAEGPLAGMSHSLAYALFCRLVESLLLDERVVDLARRQRFAALIATVSLSKRVALRTAESYLNRAMTMVPRARLWALVEFFAQIQGSWRFAESALKRDVRAYVRGSTGEQVPRTIHYALQVEALVRDAEARIAALAPEQLEILVASGDVEYDRGGELVIHSLRIRAEDVEEQPFLAFDDAREEASV